MFSKKKIRPNQIYNVQGQSYTLLNQIGFGRFGSVWTSTTQNGEYAAVKIVDFNHSGNNASLNERLSSFRTEIKMISKMRNEIEYVVTMYGYEFNPRYGMGFIILELADESLIDRVRNLHQRHLRSKIFDRYDYIPSKDRQEIWVQLMNIILALHRHRIVHRDIKPANLLFFGPIMKVIDFGIAQDELAGYSGNQRVAGSHPYSAPECFHGRIPITSKADIWSVGAILYFMTYGKRPEYETPQPPVGVSPTRSSLVQDVLNRCLQRNPNRRPDHRWLVQHPLT
ncbi:unnamed protein product [Adineta steineri]|uniref:Protein kinase domain-containing protein n=1 Tax=Adineta steineri TaxID=433720 RepID=A0A818I8E4_9BILA|nr:unnamed protein product [Adineta steineri]